MARIGIADCHIPLRIICCDLRVTALRNRTLPLIRFHNPSDALATHQEIIYFSIPFIIIGVVLILVLTVYYVSRFTNQNVLKFSIYGIVVTVIGALLTFGFIGIAIYLQEISLIIAIIPAIFLAIYGIFLIVKRKKSKNIQQTQSYSD